MRLCCCALALAVPNLVWATPIELTQKLNGSEVSAKTLDLGENMAALQLYNYGEHKAQCKAVFRNGPESPRTRRAVIEPKKEVNFSLQFKRQVIRLRIDLVCDPVSE